MGKRKRGSDSQKTVTNGSEAQVPKRQVSRTTSPSFQQQNTKPEAAQGNAHLNTRLLSPVILQVVIGTYEKVLHGFTATLLTSHEDVEQFTNVEFADTFMFNAHF